MDKKKSFIVFFLMVTLLAGCAMRAPVREAVRVDLNVPVGKIEENRFTGIRYPFNVSAPSSWKITTDFPKFMVELGYGKEGLEESEVFIFNPATQSNIQIDFTPASRYSTFSQEKIEFLTTAAVGGFEEEIEEDYGKEVKVEIGPTTPFPLKGVQYAAKKHGTYMLQGVKREQGWIYAFSEPYQIFILYMILDKGGSNDRQDMDKILSSFEFIPQQ